MDFVRKHIADAETETPI
jgi:hypothetical protein